MNGALIRLRLPVKACRSISGPLLIRRKRQRIPINLILDPQYRAVAGTINGNGAMEIQVTKLASESTLASAVVLGAKELPQSDAAPGAQDGDRPG